MEFLLVLLAAQGLTTATVEHKIPGIGILTRIRFFGAMFQCRFCTSFHTGYLAFLGWAAASGGITQQDLPGIAGTAVVVAFASAFVGELVDQILFLISTHG